MKTCLTMYIVNGCLAALLLAAISLVGGCVRTQKEFRAFVAPGATWEIKENCGYEGCYPKVDFLVSKDLTLRVEADQYMQSPYILTRIFFEKVAGQYELNPLKVAVKHDDVVLPVRVLPGSFTNRKSDYLWAEPSLEHKLSIDSKTGFVVVSKRQDNSMPNEITLHLNDAITFSGSTLQIPDIYFRKNAVRTTGAP